MLKQINLPDTDECVDLVTICPFLYHDNDFEPVCCLYKKQLHFIHDSDFPCKLEICRKENV